MVAVAAAVAVAVAAAVAVAVEPAFGTELEAEFAVSVKFAERLDVEVVTGIDVAKLVSSAAAAVAHTISTPQVSPTTGLFKQNSVSLRNTVNQE